MRVVVRTDLPEAKTIRWADGDVREWQFDGLPKFPSGSVVSREALRVVVSDETNQPFVVFEEFMLPQSQEEGADFWLEFDVTSLKSRLLSEEESKEIIAKDPSVVVSKLHVCPIRRRTQ